MCKFGNGLILRDDSTPELLARFRNGDGLFLDGLEVLGCKRFRHIELVVEAVGYGRPDAELCVGEKLLHRLRGHVCG